jgi:hypothetical protein
MEHAIDKIKKNPKLSGQIGENAIWDGPLDKTGFPMGKGSSSGKDGMEVSKYPCKYSDQPITNKAMGRGRMVR